MSSIGATNIGYLGQVSAYAGLQRTSADADAARSAATEASREADQNLRLIGELREASESGEASDRDADGSSDSSAPNGGEEQPQDLFEQKQIAGVSGPPMGADSRPYDDHRGNLINTQA